MGILNEYLRKSGDDLAVDITQRELKMATAQRNAAKSRALRLVTEVQAILRLYDGAENEWLDHERDDKLEAKAEELVKRVHEMIAHADSANRLVEEDDILRLELTKPIAKSF